ncbi:uncharacterized protein LDX57_003311 [Aspergillus melleus]|uniref:uncharacterized protein n=1 Tax=Aspergillus melleus TaxID=138277 RepID=UPI001E8E00AB|nr:uncharacterized protein LDX57_003311 [Aspergillus melleus]KAH8425561.1 hypothetical protein LDX57_003311 [Aspergillus melleus]
MDLANTLIRSVARAFYETRHILVVDALFIHSVLHVEDLAFLLGMQQKDLRKLCAKLREDRLISVYACFTFPNPTKTNNTPLGIETPAPKFATAPRAPSTANTTTSPFTR